MTSRTLTLVGLLALAASAVACSGVTASDVLDSEQTTSTTDPVPTDEESTTPTPNAGEGGTPTPTETKPGEPGEEKPEPPKEEPKPGGLAFGCGAADMEKEPNDAPQQANVITKVFCGQISAVQDFDFATFTLPDNAKALDFKVQTQDGDVIVQVAAGNRAPVTVGDGNEIRVRPGEQYRVWVRSKDGKTPKYRLDVLY